ncbi:hypothetical protein [Corallibacter sp.]|uniref:hypothetical protein n=1 Tax=Corallibacter sp. TaxID=2038084 RepID=UPI003AB1D0FD
MIKYELYKRKQQFKRFVKKALSFKPHYKTVKPYWVQKMPFKRIGNRVNFFISQGKNKDVIHFGCTDWPIFNPNNNLHIQLAKHTKSIDGFDIDTEGLEILKQYVNQNYYSTYDSIPEKKYHLCLVPETIEHVDNVRFFLESVSRINAEKFIITAPNCFARKRSKNFFIKNDEFIELVHPDHNCWFSPYTLKNTIEKYTTLKVTMIYLLENDTMVCCEAIKS